MRKGLPRLCLVGLLSAVVLCACGTKETNSLDGSIEAMGYSLAFDSVRITRTDEQLVIRYEDRKVLADGVGVTNQAARLIIDLEIVTPTVDRELRLPGEVLLEHNVIRLNAQGLKEDEADFPPVASGTLGFGAVGSSLGDEVRGHFNCVFDNGHTLLGKFSGRIQRP